MCHYLPTGRSLLKENVSLGTHCMQQSRRAQLVEEFSSRLSEGQDGMMARSLGRCAPGAKAVLDPARGEQDQALVSPGGNEKEPFLRIHSDNTIKI